MSFGRGARGALSVACRCAVVAGALVLSAGAMAVLSCSSSGADCSTPDVVHYDCEPLDAGASTPACHGGFMFQGTY